MRIALFLSIQSPQKNKVAGMFSDARNLPHHPRAGSHRASAFSARTGRRRHKMPVAAAATLDLLPGALWPEWMTRGGRARWNTTPSPSLLNCLTASASGSDTLNRWTSIGTAPKGETGSSQGGSRAIHEWSQAAHRTRANRWLARALASSSAALHWGHSISMRIVHSVAVFLYRSVSMVKAGLRCDPY